MAVTRSIIFFCIVSIFGGCMTDNANVKVDMLLDAARKKFAPDKRTIVFNVTASQSDSKTVLKGEIHSASLKGQLFNFLKTENDFAFVDSIAVLPEASLGNKTIGIVGVSVANLRTKPGHAQELATQALLGTPLKLLKELDGWYFVQTPDEYLGWTSDMLTLYTNSEYELWTRQPKIIITAASTHGYASEKRSEVVSDLVAGNILKYVRSTGNFFEVEYPSGEKAFVAKEQAERMQLWLAQAQDTPENIISTAKRFMGIPYLWGGTSAKAMDCSGFTKTVFFLNGVMLPRDASQQVSVGEPVSLEDDFAHLKKGDFLFFGRKATGEAGEKVTHVGIYIDAFKFIHASSHGRVQINSLNAADKDYSESRRNSLLRATRVIGAGEDRGVRHLASIPYYKNNEH